MRDVKEGIYMALMIMFALTVFLLGYIFGRTKINKTNRANYVARSAIIATVYVLITYLFKPISYGPTQFRISEVMTLLPLVESAAVPGLFIGCLIANILGGLGPWDIFGGSFITLLAAHITSKLQNPFLGSLPPILLNAFGISIYLSAIYGLPYWTTVLYIGVEQFVVIAVIGIPLFYALRGTSLFDLFDKGRN